MAKTYKVTVIDYTTGNYFEFEDEFPSDYDENAIGESVMMNVGIELELLSADQEEDEDE